MGCAARTGGVNYCADIACFYGVFQWFVVVTAMSSDASILSDDPAVLRAIIATLEAENAKLSATLRAHDLLVQTLRTRIAKLQKQAFGKSSEKIEREIAQLELALEDLQVAMAEADEAAGQNDDAEDNAATASEADTDEKPLRRRPRISKDAPRERRELDPGDNCPDCGGDLRILGEDVSELIDMIAAQLKVIEIARIKKSCRRCEKIVQEPTPIDARCQRSRRLLTRSRGQLREWFSAA